MGLASDFAISLNGHCLICLTTLEQAKISDGSPNSLQCLSRFLKLDRRKVFNEKGAISTHLVEKVDKARLMVDLCPDCACLNNKFLQLFNQLEKIKMEVAEHLTLFQVKLLKAGEIDKKTVMLRKWTDSNRADQNNKLEGKLEIAEVIRKDLIEKCSRKLNGLAPRIPLKKVTTENIQKMQRPGYRHFNSRQNQEHHVQPNSNAFSNSDVSSSNIKLETDHEHADAISEEDQHDYVRDLLDEGNDPSVSDSLKVNKYDTVSSRYIRTKSGKFECRTCSKVLVSYSSFYSHFRSQHLKLRFQCNTCGKTFTHKKNLTSHHESVHLKRRVSCGFCSKTFTSTANRNHHLRMTKCSRKNRKSAVPDTKLEFQETSEDCGSGRFYHMEALEPGSIAHEPSWLTTVNTDNVEINSALDEPSTNINEFENASTRYIRTKAGRFKCRTCSKVLATPGSFKCHFRNKHLKIAFTCNLCDKTFTQKANLTTHHESVHLKRRVSCKFCPKTFTSLANRSHHLKLRTCSGINSSPRGGQHKSRQTNQSHMQDPLEAVTGPTIVFPNQTMAVSDIKSEFEGTSAQNPI